MGKVFFEVGISLDGFMAGDSRSPENPMGDCGLEIQKWIFNQKAFREVLNLGEGGETGKDNDMVNDTIARTGATIMGKRMFEEGEKNWPEDLFKTPVYILTHEHREPWVQKGSTVFYFVNDGIENALEKAREVAGSRDIRIGGAQKQFNSI